MPRSTWRAGFCLSLLLVLPLLLLMGCATLGPAPRVDLPPEELWKMYVQAVQAAQYPKPSAISEELVPIVRSNPKLRWDEQGRVLMVTWTKREHYEEFVGKRYRFDHDDVWLTAVPYAQDFCRSLRLPPDKLRLRMAQLLGLPPDSGEDAFVQMWVDPEDFFRPCADPEITDRECTLNLTVHGSPRDQCPWKDSSQDQVSARWVTVTEDHLGWMCGNWSKSFPEDPRKGYPWTGLGYTYDWGQPNPVGQSELVAPKGTAVVIESITGTEEYCRERLH